MNKDNNTNDTNDANDANPLVDLNQDGMPQAPPPSYTTNNTPNNHKSYQPPTGSPLYQAQPLSGQQNYPPPEGAYMPSSSGTTYPPPAGAYTPSSSGTGRPPPAGVPGGANPNTVVYVIDNNDPMNNPQMNTGMPVAMVCFLFGICTWLGYLFGMFFLTSKDPREQFWARCCTMGAVIWALIEVPDVAPGDPGKDYSRTRDSFKTKYCKTF
ncbi:hypothetical protein BGZ96_008890 [Linnemannia gamsii]|uniref:Uncharacterized protein n=1 Tax=Linnemannia gamsii TaxID=64522 RepID=A0ABQ7JZE6_9FUNG|nr:hypothetical protein BGZ96_008890 [Linnemannia gamsii]